VIFDFRFSIFDLKNAARRDGEYHTGDLKSQIQN